MENKLKYTLYVFLLFFIPLQHWYYHLDDVALGKRQLERAFEHDFMFGSNKMLDVPFITELKQIRFNNEVLFFCKTCQEFSQKIDETFERLKDHPKFEKFNRPLISRLELKPYRVVQVATIIVFLVLYYTLYVSPSINLGLVIMPLFLVMLFTDIEFKQFSEFFLMYAFAMIAFLKYRGVKSEDIAFWKSKVFYSLTTFFILYFTSRIIYLKNHNLPVKSFMILECIYLILFYYVYYMAARALGQAYFNNQNKNELPKS